MCTLVPAETTSFTPNSKFSLLGEYKTTVSSVIYREFDLATKVTFECSKHKHGYHSIKHTKSCTKIVDVVFNNFDTFPINLEQELETYIAINSLPNIDFSELYNFVKIAFLAHDLGNIAQLEYWAKQLLTIDIEQFLASYEPNKNDKNVKNLPEGHSEINSEERSVEIALFFFKSTVANLLATTTNQEERDYLLNLHKFGKSFIKDIILYTKYSPNTEDYNLPFSIFAKFIDRVGPYYGLNLHQVVELVKKLASEKVAEKIEQKVTPIQCINFPHTALPQITQYNKELADKLNNFMRAVNGKVLPKAITSNHTILTKPMSWDEIKKLFGKETFIEVLEFK